MSQQPSFEDRERDDLVAYLDGELTGKAARAVESRIALNPATRAEADALRRTWELLDHLPQPEPSQHFTHRTVEKLGTVRAMPRPVRSATKWGPIAGWVVAASLFLMLGFFGGRVTQTHKPGDQELVRDLRVIENKRLYDVAEDFDFLRDLDVPELFGDDGLSS